MIFFLSIPLLIGPILFLCFVAYGYRARSIQAEREVNQLQSLASALYGQLIESRENAQAWRTHAHEALKLAQERHFPAEPAQRPDPFAGRKRGAWSLKCSCGYAEIRLVDGPITECPKCGKSASSADYVAPVVAFCSSCNVSVRHDPSAYPVPCPACKTLIDPVLDNPPEM